MEYPANTRVFSQGQEVNFENDNPSRLNLVVGAERRIVNIFCG
jgi:Peptidase inhibitor I78 family.